MADFIGVKEGTGRWLPALMLWIVSSGRCWDDQQMGLGETWAEGRLGLAIAGAAHAAQNSSQACKIGLPLARGETGLTPVSLAVGFIE